jgi:membrane-associated phospholipid phosphatase
MGDGANINQYTSFYSGHTSFVAYATLMSALWIRSRFGKSHFYTKMAWMSWIGITLLTATLRILGGRHYPTDTMVGTVAGTCIAFVTWWYYATSVEIYSLPTMQSK